MSEKTTEQVAQEEKEDQESLVNIAAEYTDLDIKRGFTREKEEVKIRIYRPTVADRHAANRFGKAQFVACLEAGVPTRAQAIEAGRKAGIWSDELEKKMGDITQKIESLVSDQETTTNKATKAKLREKIRTLKKQQLDIASVFTEITRNTIEQIQDDAEQSYLLVRTTFVLDEKGNEMPLYVNVEDLNGERDMRFVEQVNNAASAFWLGDSVVDFFELGELLDEETSAPATKSRKTSGSRSSQE